MKSVKIAALARVVRLCAGHVRGENSLGSRYVMKELKMDPQLEGAVAVHLFSQTNMKFKPLFLLLTSSKSLHFYTQNS